MGVPVPVTNFVCLNVTMTETQRKAAINAAYQSRQDARKLEDWLEMQPHRFVMLGINPDSYNAVVWVTSQFFGPLNNWCLNHKLQVSILDIFDSCYIDSQDAPAA
jgi:glyceraldehyde-3-phosphate dehydrogenase/erythrose-4-phosphate dehydrogenase